MPPYFIRLKINESFDTIYNLLKEKFGNVYYNILNESPKRVGIIIGTKWFMKSNSEAAINIFIHETNDQTILDLVAYGGREGVFGFSLGVHEDFARQVMRFVKKKDIRYKRILEIKRFSPDKLKKIIENTETS